MAKNRDVTLEYGAPDGHKIVENLNYIPDASYRGLCNVKHLVSVLFLQPLVLHYARWLSLQPSVEMAKSC